ITPELLAQWEQEAKLNPPIYSASFSVPILPIPNVIDQNRFSNLHRLLNTTSYVFKFLRMRLWNKLSEKTKSKYPLLCTYLSSSSQDDTRTDELKKSRLYWERVAQKSTFKEVINACTHGHKHLLKDQLNLFLDSDGLLRLQGRLENARCLSADSIHPKLVPTDHWFTWLVVRDHHKELQHAGVESTLASVRQEYWIPKGRTAVRKIIRGCFGCKRFRSKPYQLPPMPALPSKRVLHFQPFQNIGLDYFGPISISTLAGLKKIWICLFTCCVTRAIHLELVSDMSSLQFLNCFRRFIARRGKPVSIISDNAPQFVLMDEMMDSTWHSMIHHPNTISYFSNHRIQWHFITAYSPWKGGFYERMVALTKRVIKQALGRKIVTFETLLTYIAETEAIVNSRPLCHIEEDGRREIEILRPVDFLAPHAIIGSAVFDDDPSAPDDVPAVDSAGK
ncbi:MAG: transposase family protein, partial [Gammaproteobacteria bacterium]|nr:transposase family protein [Gammaproteobacteria bacterium]